MTSADPFTRACPLFVRAQSLAGRNGAALEWTGSGNWFGLPRLFGAGRATLDRRS